jgi:ATP-dependent DNA helicase RecG
MEIQELLSLLRDIESDRAERKASVSDMSGIRHAVCGFANDLPNHARPGVIFVGVNDDGSCADLPIDLPITDELLRNLTDIRSDGNTLPTPHMEVRKVSMDECEMAIVVVHPSDRPPVRYRGRTCVRVGPRRSYATLEEERWLSERSRARNLPFDVQPAGGLTFEDLNLDWFQNEYLPAAIAPDILINNARPREHQLTSLRFATPESPPRPTNLSALVLASDPRLSIPGAYVQFLRFDGTELTDPILDQKELDGPVASQLRRLSDVLEINISTATDINNELEIRRPDYPILALHQIARNAVMHRTYEGTASPVRIYWFRDRVEIHSPGGPYGLVNRANFGQPGVSDYRNPHLAEALKNMGFVQRFGIGIPTARLEMEKNGNPPIRFEVHDTHVNAILARRG